MCPWAAALALINTAATAEEWTLLEDNQPARALIPSAANGGSTLGATWTAPAFDDFAWVAGNTGVGFDAEPGSGGNYTTLARLDVSAMRNATPSVFIRVPFSVEESVKAGLRRLTLEMRYDDGFVAWINGVEAASALKPATLAWNSATLNGQTHDAGPDGPAETFDLTPHLALLRTDGPNVLAIQGLNANNSSSDLLIAPRLTGSDVPPLPWPEVRLAPVPGASGLDFPVGVRGAGDGSGCLFIIERRGRIKVLSKGVVSTFLDITSRVRSSASSGDEQGLLGLAFPPGFPAQRPYFYVYYTTSVAPNAGDHVLSRFFLNPSQGSGPANTANAASEVAILRLDDPYSNHNGGDMHFGRDGFLYIGLGDGGSGDDPQNRAQNPNDLWGKMLRLDVESGDPSAPGYAVPQDNPFTGQAGVKPEIWHLGLRNPWRWSFDRETGDMWIGDVGQGAYEEINFAPHDARALNFGWRRYEGFHVRPGEPAAGGTAITLGTLTEPVTETTHASGDLSITGGHVYRGARFPALRGLYFFADYGSRRFYGLQHEGERWERRTLIASTGLRLTGFGEGDDGELYAAHLQTSGANSGSLHQIGATMGANHLQVDAIAQDAATGRASFTFGAALGRTYQPEASEDLVTWTSLGPPITAAYWTVSFTEPADPPAGTTRRFLRVVDLTGN